MGKLTRDERLALQKKDNKNGDDKVFIKESNNATRYHEDDTCRTFNNDVSIKQITRKAA